MSREILFKLLILGDGGVGKTSLVDSFLEGKKFSGSYLPTLGANVQKKTYPLDPDLTLILTIWDIGGQKSFNVVQPQYFHETAAALLVFDITRPQTLKNLKKEWLSLLKQQVNRRIPTFVVGNKADIPIDNEKMAAITTEIDGSPFPVYLVSAKKGYNVDNLFEFMVCSLLEGLD